MSLTASMEIAKSSLSTLQERSTVVSRNIANASNPYASRKVGETVSNSAGGVRIAAMTRAANTALFQNVLTANAAANGQKAIVDSLDQLNVTVADPEQDFSPAALAGKLSEALQSYSAGPADSIRAQSVLNSAADLVDGLNAATETTQGVRRQADADIAISVDNINSLLADVEKLNDQIVNGTFVGDDVTDKLDMRDKLIAGISNEIGIRVTYRADNDIAIYTDSGVTLFDKIPRKVSFTPTSTYNSTISGSPVVVDGVTVTGDSASMAIGSGRLKGLTDVRDTFAVTYQGQLDEIARGLIETFAETDQTGSGLPAAAGLFTYSGGPAIPASGTLITGLAGSIRVNPAVDPDAGGDLNLIRDGGINGAAYTYNTSGAASFSTRIRSVADGLTTNRPFDPTVQAGAEDSVLDFAASSVGWLQQQRSATNADFEFNQTVQERSINALDQVIGVNLDTEMTLLLEIERSYQATSRLIATIDNMYDALLAAA